MRCNTSFRSTRAVLALVLAAGAVQAVLSPPAYSAPLTLSTSTPVPAGGLTDAFVNGLQPVRISIPTISVNAEIVPVGLNPKTKSLIVPKQGSIVGWFSRGAQQRPTVLVGHVDTAKRAAVFYRLPKLRTGDEIRVFNSDNSSRRYRVDRITRIDKDKFPTRSVYLGTGLRLITCGGKFDRKTGHYEDNIIVFAKAI
jgi:LPXTG-site transpeptidase (sortase) family protein